MMIDTTRWKVLLETSPTGTGAYLRVHDERGIRILWSDVKSTQEQKDMLKQQGFTLADRFDCEFIDDTLNYPGKESPEKTES